MSSPSDKNEIFWLENPNVLITNSCAFNPLSNGSFSYNMNSYTRLIIITMIILFAVTKEVNYIYIGLFLIVLVIILYYTLKNENFSNIENLNKLKELKQKSHSLLDEEMLPRRKSDYFNIKKKSNNPLKNVQLTDLNKPPQYSKSTVSNSDMSKFIKGKMFQASDQFIFDRNTVQFNTTPNTSIPNDQTGFANWLYGTENNCKAGSIYMHRTGTPIECQNCNGFNVSTPTNFGNLNDY